MPIPVWLSTKENDLRRAAVAGLLLLFLLFPTPYLPAASGGGPRHDYDAVTDAVVSWRLTPGERVMQSFVVPPDVRSVSGFRVRLSRVGLPGPVRYRLGSRPGGEEVVWGRLETSGVNPWFERWYTVVFERPRPVKPGRTYYLQLELSSTPLTGHLEVYGTSRDRMDDERFQPRFQYTRLWYPTEEDRGIFENPANLDYGTSTPVYSAGHAFDDSAKPLTSLDLAFEILAAADSDPSAEGSCQERFAFTEEITGPLFPHSLRDPATRPGPEEFALSGWSLQYRSHLGEVVRTAAEGFQSFLSSAMEEALEVRSVEGFLPVPGTILLGLVTDFPSAVEGLDRPESFHLEVTPRQIRIVGFDERGIMRGLYLLESWMKVRRAPFLQARSELRRPRHSPRITTSPFLARAELEVPEDPYTDGLLARISRAGFNAIWLWGYLDEVASSSVYPELNRSGSVPGRQEKLRGLIDRARPFGIDVYMYLANRPLPESFFKDRSHLQGSYLPAHGGTHILCTSVPEVREHLTSATKNLMESVPGLQGIVFIIGGEGFIHCHTRTNTCPRCIERSPQETISELSDAVLRGVKSGNSEAKAVVWPYSASNLWSKDDVTQSKLIRSLPEGIVFMSEFGKEGLITFGDVTIPAYDYPISYVGPSERILQQRDLAMERGLEFWIKNEHAIALEFIQTPYIPVLQQWAERFERLHGLDGVTGVFGNWMHYGFMPTPAADLHAHYVWENPPDRAEVLLFLAKARFGEAAAHDAVEAWRLLSLAIREYPFSGPMALGVIQKGPSHPLFLDPDYRPAHGAGRQFRNDLDWTRPWGPELALSQLRKMELGWRAGVSLLERVAVEAVPGLRDNARLELGVARALHHCILSTIHLIEFHLVRDRLFGEAPSTDRAELLKELVDVARRELENARRVLPVVCADSRLGFANSGGSVQTGVPRAGIYSPGAIEKKVRQVERLLEHEIPELKRRLEQGEGPN